MRIAGKGTGCVMGVVGFLKARKGGRGHVGGTVVMVVLVKLLRTEYYAQYWLPNGSLVKVKEKRVTRPPSSRHSTTLEATPSQCALLVPSLAIIARHITWVLYHCDMLNSWHWLKRTSQRTWCLLFITVFHIGDHGVGRYGQECRCLLQGMSRWATLIGIHLQRIFSVSHSQWACQQGRHHVLSKTQ